MSDEFADLVSRRTFVRERAQLHIRSVEQITGGSCDLFARLGIPADVVILQLFEPVLDDLAFEPLTFSQAFVNPPQTPPQDFGFQPLRLLTAIERFGDEPAPASSRNSSVFESLSPPRRKLPGGIPRRSLDRLAFRLLQAFLKCCQQIGKRLILFDDSGTALSSWPLLSKCLAVRGPGAGWTTTSRRPSLSKSPNSIGRPASSTSPPG